jgi:hypothetical protein
MAEKRNWFRRHWAISTILGIFLLFLVVGMLQEASNSITGKVIKESSSLQNALITTDASLLLPQNSEIDRIWRINEITAIATNATGFIEGAERKISKTESLSGSSIIMKVYRFDSADNANQFYEQEKGKIDIRGVQEWNLDNGCFGIEKESFLSGAVEGLCLRENIVFYTRSSSTSYDYASDGKSFMKIMLKKI